MPDRSGGESSDPEQDRDWIGRVRAGLLAWYDLGHRDLPWRRSGDPYAVLVSEVMLVQTTVEAVVPYFERFLARFPSVEALAEAPEEEVVKAWEGLGYYRRARQLWAAARAIRAEHGGVVPSEPEALRALPGVGPYIAGAVASIAFDRPAPILEANSERVLGRLVACEEPAGSSAFRTRLWGVADRLVRGPAPGRLNQALMELGATVCVPRAPRCLGCPVAHMCRARSAGRQESIPVRRPRAEPLPVREQAALIERQGRHLLLRRGPKGLWAGFWEFPTIWIEGSDPAKRRASVQPEAPESAFRRLTGLDLGLGPILGSFAFGVTRYRVELAVVRAEDRGGPAGPSPAHAEIGWFAPADFDGLAMGSAQRKVARLASPPGVF